MKCCSTALPSNVWKLYPALFGRLGNRKRIPDWCCPSKTRILPTWPSLLWPPREKRNGWGRGELYLVLLGSCSTEALRSRSHCPAAAVQPVGPGKKLGGPEQWKKVARGTSRDWYRRHVWYLLPHYIQNHQATFVLKPKMLACQTNDWYKAPRNRFFEYCERASFQFLGWSPHQVYCKGTKHRSSMSILCARTGALLSDLSRKANDFRVNPPQKRSSDWHP